MKQIVFFFLVLPFFVTALIFVAIIAAAINEYGKIDFADVVLFIGACYLVISGIFINKLRIKFL